MKNLEKIEHTLKKNNLRVTSSRKAVAEVLLSNPKKFFSSDDIYQKLGKSCDPVSVYRVLSTFHKIGIIKKSHFHGEAAKFQIEDDSTSNHNHYFKCTQCSTVEPLGSCLVTKKEQQLVKLGYSNLSHHLEIKGLCPQCS